MAIATRQSDEALLEMLRRYCQGQTIAHIARVLGRSENSVGAMISKVRSDDIAQSGEPPLLVEAGYRRIRGGARAAS